MGFTMTAISSRTSLISLPTRIAAMSSSRPTNVSPTRSTPATRSFTNGASATWNTRLARRFTNDNSRNGLFQTEHTRRVDKVNSEDGTPLSATTRQDDIFQTSIGLYYENKLQWAEKFRTVAGVRGDIYNFDVDSSLDAKSGDRTGAIGSP